MTVGQKIRRLISIGLRRLGFSEESFLILMAVVIGGLTGMGSVGFTKLIHYFHRLCYGGEGFQGLYHGKWFLLVLLPTVGGLLVGAITYFFAREAKGHGVPEVMDAIARRSGIIRPRVALAKAVSSALTIGSGGSAGTEGPIIQIGAAIGSSVGQYFGIVKHNMAVLVGCGAAAGISAIFHAPIAGVLFALEIFLREMSFKTFSPVLVASVISSVTVSGFLGKNEAIFPLVSPNTVYVCRWYELGNYVVLGVIAAAVGVIFVKALYATEDIFDKARPHQILKPAIGAIMLGILGVAAVYGFGDTRAGEPVLFGNGYPFIGRCIGADVGQTASPLGLSVTMLVLVLAFKVGATCFTLGSGGSGGVFAPSLFMGAAAGYAFGLLMERTGLFTGIHAETYAIVGMAAVVAATTHAVLTAIVIVFEMTRSYHIILPVMFSATIATAGAQLMLRDSIYTLKLRRRGIDFVSRANRAMLRRLTVRMVMQHRFEIVQDNVPVQEVINRALSTELSDFIVTDKDGHYLGMLMARDLRAVLLQRESVPFLVASELVDGTVPTVSAEETLDTVLDKFARHETDALPVVSDEKGGIFIGMVTRAALMRRHQQEMDAAR